LCIHCRGDSVYAAVAWQRPYIMAVQLTQAREPKPENSKEEEEEIQESG
jgi:hypothetical protein